uniref:glucan endo-1,3-beta-D-glucosidase n=1 Tax=Albugo laibachii Nc14 TaxID=890382 RepID=F0WLI0_9STRA|nr:putative endo1 [Albugo laibachii Nc14]|eukprot:CCA22143.1 putative endo1 [Albugo laibachii Nc14]
MVIKRILSTAVIAVTLTLANAQLKKISGINYSMRKGADWLPHPNKCKSTEEITLDLDVLKTVTDNIRLYSVGDCDCGSVVIPIARRAGLKVAVGLWVDSNNATFIKEKETLETLMANGIITSSNVVSILVSSEALYRNEISLEMGIKYLNQIKELRDRHNLQAIPLSIADIGDIYIQYPQIIDHVDFCAINAFPYWEDKDIKEAASRFKSRIQGLIVPCTKGGNVKITISETGWPTDGRSEKVTIAVASHVNARRYFDEFTSLAEMEGWNYYYFEAFDSAWKLEQVGESHVEGYFGLFDGNRKLKEAYLDSILSPGQSSTPGTLRESASTTSSMPAQGTSPTTQPLPLHSRC